MIRTALALTLAFCAFAADPAPPKTVPSEKAPPEVDAALRERARFFFQAHVDGKFRAADKVVAEDTKDVYFSMSKNRYEGFEIQKVAYSEDFKWADVQVLVKGHWSYRGQRMPYAMAVTTPWKLENGEWVWYMLQTAERETPFGKMHVDSGQSGDQKDNPERKTALPADPKVLAAQILSAVKADKTDLELSSYQPADTSVSIQNGVNGVVTLKVEFDSTLTGLKAKVADESVPAGGTTRIDFSYVPTDKRPKPTITGRIVVSPTSQEIPFRITFAIPPELEKTIPPEARPQKPRN